MDAVALALACRSCWLNLVGSGSVFFFFLNGRWRSLGCRTSPQPAALIVGWLCLACLWLHPEAFGRGRGAQRAIPRATLTKDTANCCYLGTKMHLGGSGLLALQPEWNTASHHRVKIKLVDLGPGQRSLVVFHYLENQWKRKRPTLTYSIEGCRKWLVLEGESHVWRWWF